MSLLDRATLLLLAVTFGCLSYYAWVHRPGPAGQSGAQDVRQGITRWLGPFAAVCFVSVALAPAQPGGAPLPAWLLPLAVLLCAFSLLLVRSERRKARRRNP